MAYTGAAYTGRAAWRAAPDGSGAGGGVAPGRIARAGSRAVRHPRAGYFFGKIPVLLVPPQNTLVPTRSRRPLPAHLRQRRNDPL